MNRSCILAAVLLMLTACATTQPRTQLFEQTDLDHDGRIVLAEWLRFGGAEASFLAADFEHKGYLNEPQFRDAVRLNDEATGGATQQRALDAQIMSDIKRALQDSRDVNAWNIRVDVYQRNVTLTGPVRTAREKQAAEQISAAVQGVGAVFNQLVVKE
ncbi:MAG TPA: BON domain-containing protein [Geomonas sp.]|nr:BON domain-containing protein [Geomonas sp.]